MKHPIEPSKPENGTPSRWKVVQTSQGRVRPTLPSTGRLVDDTDNLELAADELGREATKATSTPE
jgi:hypothetical protein